MNNEKRIYDPLYDIIPVETEEELQVIDSQPIQRLRNVKQLGLSPKVYPSANHSRFSHSLGVMHLAGEMVESLNLSDEEKTLYRLGGLLHDIGHPPYSHGLEEIMEERIGIGHEEHTCLLIDEIEDTLPVDPNRIKKIVQGESKYDIVAGVVDVDRLDYLNRDYHHSGLPYGINASETIIEFAKIHNDEIVFEEPARRALTQMLEARMDMSYSMYQHHTAQILELMLERSVESFIDSSVNSYTIWDIIQMDDSQLHTYLLEYDNIQGNLYQRINERNPYKRALFIRGFDIPRERMYEYAEKTENAKKIEQIIAEKTGIENKYILVDTPRIPRSDREPIKILKNNGEIVDLHNSTDVVQSLEEAEWANTSFGVYTNKENIKQVKEAVCEVLDVPQELQ